MYLALTQHAPIGGTLADPDGSNALLAAVMWLQGTMLGTLATTVAVVAVASVGFMMLTGRVSFRHGGTVIAGCFVLFGATSIVAGIRGGLSGGTVEAPAYVPPAIPTPRASATPSGYDPYAGASVPSG